MAWLGLSELWRWCTTGALLTYSRGMDHVTRWQLITCESHFVSLFIIYGVVAATGVTICTMQCLLIRRWGLKKPAAGQ